MTGFSDLFAEESVDDKLDAQRAIDKLGHIDRAVLYLWVIGYTQREIGYIFGYSERHIRRILARVRCPNTSQKVAVVDRDYCEN